MFADAEDDDAVARTCAELAEVSPLSRSRDRRPTTSWQNVFITSKAQHDRRMMGFEKQQIRERHFSNKEESRSRIILGQGKIHTALFIFLPLNWTNHCFKTTENSN